MNEKNQNKNKTDTCNMDFFIGKNILVEYQTYNTEQLFRLLAYEKSLKELKN